MFKSWFFENPFGRSCFALAQTFETKLHREEVKKKLPKDTQNDFLRKFLLVHIIPQSAFRNPKYSTDFQDNISFGPGNFILRQSDRKGNRAEDFAK
jgi:hypothetical protein